MERMTDLTPADRAAIVAPLDAFSRERGFPWQPTPLAFALREEAGSIVGGLIGEINWGWLRIEILAVAEEFRGDGWGRRLVEEAERTAVATGCHGAWVDTFSFQAPEFYRRLGYHVFGELPDYPAGQTRYFLAKRLTEGEAAPVAPPAGTYPI
ncbi:Acetyltransferase [Fimbriiglobus ruber]|uniref:Acetyltransferase n=1 Tax=Fimbriiglobus ruber TaxID=1908690 RepID=A0A225D7Q6_9BACT|nr:Acetyltransferase [Fimbriiglobus ruber]